MDARSARPIGAARTNRWNIISSTMINAARDQGKNHRDILPMPRPRIVTARLNATNHLVGHNSETYRELGETDAPNAALIWKFETAGRLRDESASWKRRAGRQPICRLHSRRQVRPRDGRGPRKWLCRRSGSEAYDFSINQESVMVRAIKRF